MSKLTTLIEKAITLPKEVIMLRGYTISKVISIEKLINEILITLINPQSVNDDDEIIIDVVGKMSNQHRNDTLKKVLLKLGEPEVKTKSTIRDILYLYEIRNALAHWEWNYISNNGIVVCKKQNSSSTIKRFDDELLDRFETAYNNVRNHLSRISYSHVLPKRPGFNTVFDQENSSEC